MKIVSFTDLYCCFITFYCSILFYFTLCHVLSIMMFKCTLMKEQINFLKSNQNLLFLVEMMEEINMFKSKCHSTFSQFGEVGKKISSFKS